MIFYIIQIIYQIWMKKKMKQMILQMKNWIKRAIFPQNRKNRDKKKLNLPFKGKVIIIMKQGKQKGYNLESNIKLKIKI